jgi:hypothetical protein
MAHANPEFALGLMRHEASPVRFQTRKPASFGALRNRMASLALTPREELTTEERTQVDLWLRMTRQSRAQLVRERSLVDAIAEPVGGMHAASKRGERFCEPKRRYPADVQAGRVKPRRSVLPR